MGKQYFSNLHIKYILYQILLGLNYVHTAGIVNRDLKPENIIINEECVIRICDFGLARGVTENLEIKMADIRTQSESILDLQQDDDTKHADVEDEKEETNDELNGGSKRKK